MIEGQLWKQFITTFQFLVRQQLLVVVEMITPAKEEAGATSVLGPQQWLDLLVCGCLSLWPTGVPDPFRGKTALLGFRETLWFGWSHYVAFVTSVTNPPNITLNYVQNVHASKLEEVPIRNLYTSDFKLDMNILSPSQTSSLFWLFTLYTTSPHFLLCSRNDLHSHARGPPDNRWKYGLNTCLIFTYMVIFLVLSKLFLLKGQQSTELCCLW